MKDSEGLTVYRIDKATVMAWLGLAILFFHPSIFAASLSFRVEERVVQAISLDDMARLLPLGQLKVRDPVSGQEIVYEGYFFTDVLRAVFGPDWSRYKMIEFTSSDGYRPTMTTIKARQHQGFIAIRDRGKSALTPLQRTNGTVIGLGAFYLVWENIRDADAAKNAELSWPWQLESISLR